MGLFKLTKARLLPVIVILLLTTSCAVKRQVNNDDQLQIETKVITSIRNLPEVVNANILCKKRSHGSKHLVAYITGRPSASQSFYTVKISENQTPASAIWYSFIVYPKTNKIYYLDTKRAKYIPLAVWRRQKYYNVMGDR